MAHDSARAVPLPAIEPAANDITLPTPRTAIDSPVDDVARPAPELVAPDITPPVRGSHAGGVLLTVIAAAAAWAIGWLAGVSWAWHEMTPRYLSRHHRRRGASLPATGSPVRS